MGDRRKAIQFHNQALAAAADKSQPTNIGMSYQLFQSAVIADPLFADGWMAIGNAVTDLKLAPAAVAAFRRMLELPMGHVIGDLNTESKAKALCNIGHQLQKMGKTKEARKYTEQSIALNPNLSYAYMNMSLIERDEGNDAAAVSMARKGFEIEMQGEKPRPIVEFALALALLFNGDYDQGLFRFESRFLYRLPQFTQYPYPQWHGEEGKTVSVISEQGMGDAISFSRFLEAACKRSRFVYAVVQPELCRLFRAMFQHVPNIEFVPSPSPFQPADCWSSFMSLPTALGLSKDEIINAPSVVIPAFQAPGGWKSSDRKYHVGVAWRGSPASDIDEHRSFSINNLLELYRVNGVQFYSLQVGEATKELHQSGSAALIRDLSPYLKDWADTVGFVRELDLVICVESALAHLCGTMGSECWIPYSAHGRDWRIGTPPRKPLWYPAHKIFPQVAGESWSPTFEKITEALREKVNAVN